MVLDRCLYVLLAFISVVDVNEKDDVVRDTTITFLLIFPKIDLLSRRRNTHTVSKYLLCKALFLLSLFCNISTKRVILCNIIYIIIVYTIRLMHKSIKFCRSFIF